MLCRKTPNYEALISDNNFMSDYICPSTTCSLHVGCYKHFSPYYVNCIFVDQTLVYFQQKEKNHKILFFRLDFIFLILCLANSEFMLCDFQIKKNSIE